MEFSNDLITSYTKYPMFNFSKVQLSEQMLSNWTVDAFSCQFLNIFFSIGEWGS